MTTNRRTDNGGPIARRAVVRWGIRLFRREWRQQLLILGLLTISVAAVVGISTGVYTVAPAIEKASFGLATHRYTLEDADPADIEATIAAARTWFDEVEVIRRGKISVVGRGDPIDVRVQDPDGVLGAPMLALRDGRYPTEFDELAVSEVLADQLGMAVGSGLRIDGGPEMQVVGLVENPNRLDELFVVASPAFGKSASSVTLLVNADQAQSETFRGAGDPIPILSSLSSSGGLVSVAVLVTTEMALVLVSLIAAAGFVAVAQRRQRQLGMLAAIGATEKHLRLVTVSNGVAVGVVAALLGAALGLLGWFVAAPLVGEITGQRLSRFEVPWWLVGVIVILAIATTTAASWWPARVVAKVPITEALAGRRPRPQKPRHSAAAAFGFMVAGVVALALAGDIATPRANGIAIHNAIMVATGSIAIIIGVLLLSPLAIGLLGARAQRLRLPIRIAFRDLARYRSRSGAALAAISLALGIPLAVVIAAASAQDGADTGNLSSTQLIISAEDITAPFVTPRSPAEQDLLDRRVSEVVSQLDGATSIDLQKVLDPALEVTQFGLETIRIQRPDDETDGRPLYLATDQLLEVLGVRPPPPGIELITSEEGDIAYYGPVDPSTGRHPPQPVANAARIETAYTSLPASFITVEGMRARGWVAAHAGWLVETAVPLTDDQISDILNVARSTGLTMEVRDNQRGLLQLRNIAIVVGMALALGILAMTVGLLRSEAGRDLKTLTATGATSSTRRALTASTAAGLAMLGVALAVLGAFSGLAAVTGEIPAVPLANLASIALGVPTVAALAGWIAAGLEPESLTRELLD